MSHRLSALLARLLGFLATLVGASVLTFTISNIVPSDPARLIAGDGASPEIVARIRESLGLERPLWEQYLRYLGNLVQGDLGVSIRSGEPVLQELARAAPATIELALVSVLLIAAISLPLGAIAALNRNRPIDHAVRLVSSLSMSTPTFWSGLILIGFFSVFLGLTPLGGRMSADLAPTEPVTGFVILDALLAGRIDAALDALLHILLPALTLAVAASGSLIRVFRASLLEVLQQDFVRRARAAGLSEWRILTRYAAPPSLAPVLTTMGLMFADLLGGAVVTEIIFNWPGLGTYTMQAIAGLDFPAIMGFTLLAATGYATINLAVDGLISVLDPRTRRLS